MTITDTGDRFRPFEQRMRAEGLPDIAIRTFAHHYAELVAGETGQIPERDIAPATDVLDAATLPADLAEAGRAALTRTVVIKLNGGLGTTMGLAKAKSLLAVKQGRSFLEIIARACAHQSVPLLLMNSFATRDDSLAAIAPHLPAPAGDSDSLPPDFLQHKVPKVTRADLSPADWPANPALTWCPPGHGDLYPSLVSSGLLARLLEAGYEYAFVSNADNLGAVVDETILGHVAAGDIPFLMEVADRTAADRKGGHLARRPDGQLLLRESAQCPAADTDAFGDITRHRYFNTNNLWLCLPALQARLDATGGILALPLIVNAKTVDPRDPGSTPVYQLETAMGAAIAAIPGSAALRVDRARFSPVKSTGDLLAVRSDAYLLTDDHRVVVHPDRTRGPLSVVLDPAHYQRIDQLDDHFPHGPPSLIDCDALQIQGNVRFGRNVRIIGTVKLTAAPGETRTIKDGARIKGRGRS
jgi:UTP--glucose-1-phosphate uridylyltransferase